MVSDQDTDNEYDDTDNGCDCPDRKRCNFSNAVGTDVNRGSPSQFGILAGDCGQGHARAERRLCAQ